MGKLNQVIAVVAPKKKQAVDALTEVYHKIQKPELFGGITKTYTPKDEEGDRLPSESKNVQAKVRQLLEDVRGPLTSMLDITATQDWSNCEAKADVKVNGTVLLQQVPVTYLLFLEKQLNDLKTFVGKLPVLDPAENWQFDSNANCYATLPSETTRTKKVPRPFIKYEATKEHPAQVEVVHDDILVGYWKTTKFSGAIPAKDRDEMLERVRGLQEAVVTAREEANSREVEPTKVGSALLDYVFG